MSLYQLTELMDVEVLTYFKNCHLRGIHTEDLYADDNKIDKETGKVYKFSVSTQNVTYLLIMGILFYLS